MAAANAPIRFDEDLMKRVRRVAAKRELDTGDSVALKDVLDEVVKAALPAIEKAAGLSE